MAIAPVEHPFAEYIRILGRGKKGARSLTLDEARQAMSMIMNDEVEPLQLGAFLMLLRVKEESPEELAGFTQAVRQTLELSSVPDVQLDWPSYAGKRRHLPWYVLAALLLAAHGIPVFMHGTRGTKDDRLYTDDAIKALGLPVSTDLHAAGEHIKQQGFAYIPLEHFAPKLKEILDLRRQFGLRSPINTLLRVLNPSGAPCLLQSTFHPGYRQIHQQAALLLGHENMSVFKGEGGEIERDPDKPCDVYSVYQGDACDETWPALFSGRRHVKQAQLDINRLKAVWSGEVDEYAEATITGTAAIALRLLGRASSAAEAQALAEQLWRQRPIDWLTSH
jgi:anthranilate phosphoribosyltransferase